MVSRRFCGTIASTASPQPAKKQRERTCTQFVAACDYVDVSDRLLGFSGGCRRRTHRPSRRSCGAIFDPPFHCFLVSFGFFGFFGLRRILKAEKLDHSGDMEWKMQRHPSKYTSNPPLLVILGFILTDCLCCRRPQWAIS